MVVGIGDEEKAMAASLCPRHRANKSLLSPPSFLPFSLFSFFSCLLFIAYYVSLSLLLLLLLLLLLSATAWLVRRLS